MCELFGICSKSNYIVNDYLKEFYSHSDKHPHGWGLACLEGNEASIEKEPVQASRSAYLKSRLSAPLCVKTALAHIRCASIGNIIYHNCHPYTRKDDSGRRWTLIHNGTIFDDSQISIYSTIFPTSTDSERVLQYLVDLVNEKEYNMGRAMTAEERFWLLDASVCKLSKNNKLNLIIYDGEQMYVHTNYADTLHYLKKRDGYIFSTKALSQEEWQPVPFMTLLGYQEGRLVFEGTNHGNEYFETEENLQMLYQIAPDPDSIIKNPQ